MALTKQLLLVCLLGTVALAAAVDAQTQLGEERERGGYEHRYKQEKKMVIKLYVIDGTTTFKPQSDSAPGSVMLGDTAVFSGRQVSATPGGPACGKLYLSGVYTEVESKAKFVNYVASIILEETEEFPAGKIFSVGDGTGVSDLTHMPKPIVGGTGAYVGVSGVISRSYPGPYVITLFDLPHEGY